MTLGHAIGRQDEISCFMPLLLLPILTLIIDVTRSHPPYNPQTCFPNGRNHWGGADQWLCGASNENKGQVSGCSFQFNSPLNLSLFSRLLLSPIPHPTVLGRLSLVRKRNIFIEAVKPTAVLLRWDPFSHHYFHALFCSSYLSPLPTSFILLSLSSLEF